VNHRRLYMQAHGAIPEGADIHHLGGRNDCTNHEHLIALLPHDHVKFHRYLCDLHETSRVIVKQRKTTSLADDPVVSAAIDEYLATTGGRVTKTDDWEIVDPFDA